MQDDKEADSGESPPPPPPHPHTLFAWNCQRQHHLLIFIFFSPSFSFFGDSILFRGPNALIFQDIPRCCSTHGSVLRDETSQLCILINTSEYVRPRWPAPDVTSGRVQRERDLPADNCLAEWKCEAIWFLFQKLYCFFCQWQVINLCPFRNVEPQPMYLSLPGNGCQL